MAAVGATAKVHIDDESASLELPRRAMTAFLPGMELALVSMGGDLLLALREEAARSGFLVGNLRPGILAEQLESLASSLRNGRLVVAGPRGRKTISFREGQVTFASSTEPNERLGSLLTRRGLISVEQLERSLKGVRPGRKLGQVLTQSGLISSATLYRAVSGLVEEIVVNLFELREGHFLFLENATAPDDEARPELRTRDLLAAGLKRMDEVERLRSTLPLKARVSAGPNAANALSQAVRAALVSGPTLEQLRTAFEHTEHAFLSWAVAALESGALQTATPQPTARRGEPMAGQPGKRSPTQLYADLFAVIAQALQEAGGDLSELRAFLSDPGLNFAVGLQGVAVGPGGELVLPTESQLAGREGAMARARLFEALDSFVAFSLFAARNSIGPEAEAKLLKAVRRLRREQP